MRTLIKITVLLLSFLPFTVCADETIIFPGYDLEFVKQMFEKASLTDIEGIWRFMPDGAAVTIERAEMRSGMPVTKYNVIMTESVDDEVEVGTLIGYVYATADPTRFKAKLFTNIHGYKSSKLKNFELTLSDKAHLNFMASNNKIRLDFWRWIPYLFRVSVVRNKESNVGTTGCVKIFPETQEAIQEPRHL